ncbi:hypothetical protein [Nocardia cyriacigeorgica]|uniref:Uncharacterized protein n=1 Tax=Nocardia cyriacigeorgica TaxID=135487 RepID=A0A5R8NMC5_9NOCA|nr:hypothetical protein [Nocardia cyriacigeorgica]TLF76773.1 hypothetical protein FEK34_17975 [Nocardia cyriacigeorgica]
MTVSMLFGLLAAGHLALAWLCVRRLRSDGNGLLIIPLLLCLALVYDNAVIGAGRVIGAGELLELMSVPRFAVHAVLAPLLISWARAAAERAGVSWARTRPAILTTWVLTGCAIAVGVVNDVIGLSLRPESWAGTLRYANVPAPDAEALPVVLTGLFVLVVGISLWVRRRYLPLLVAASVMTVAASSGSPFLANLGELVLSAGLVSTAQWLRRTPEAAPLPGARIARVTRTLGWIAFPPLVATTVLTSTPASDYTIVALAEAGYQILLVIHAQLGIALYGLPPKGSRLRRFHTGFGYANIPLVIASQLLTLFAATTALAKLLSVILLVSISFHVGIGIVFARRRRRTAAIAEPRSAAVELAVRGAG